MTFQALDTELLLLINRSSANPLFDQFMPSLSAHGYLLILPYVAYLLFKSVAGRNGRNRTFATTALLVLAIAYCSVFLSEPVEQFMKNGIGRIRPCRSVDGLRMLVPCPRSFSMPSGHAISSFAAAAPLFYLPRHYLKLLPRLFPLLLAGLIAYSRIYLGVHYPSDVAVGAALGTMIGLFLSFFLEWIRAGRKPGRKNE